VCRSSIILQLLSELEEAQVRSTDVGVSFSSGADIPALRDDELLSELTALRVVWGLRRLVSITEVGSRLRPGPVPWIRDRLDQLSEETHRRGLTTSEPRGRGFRPRIEGPRVNGSKIRTIEV
jgi:hypothetical protein